MPLKNQNKFVKTKINKKPEKKIIEEKTKTKEIKNFIWLKYKENSCRYDAFTLIYYFIIKDIINCKELPDNLNILIEFYKKFIENITNT